MKITLNPSNSEILIPRFSLAAAGRDDEVSPAQFRQKSNLLIFFTHSAACGHCRTLLSSLREMAPVYARMETSILSISADPLAELQGLAETAGPDIPLLSDPDGGVISSYAGMTGDPGKPFLVIADRFGAFYSRLELDEGEEIDHEEIQSTIMFIETQCPECGAPQGDTMP